MMGKREKNTRPVPKAPLEYSQMLLRFLDIQNTLTHEKTDGSTCSFRPPVARPRSLSVPGE